MVEEVTEKFSYNLAGYAKPKLLYRIPLFPLNLPSKVCFFPILDVVIHKNIFMNAAMAVWLTGKKSFIYANKTTEKEG